MTSGDTTLRSTTEPTGTWSVPIRAAPGDAFVVRATVDWRKGAGFVVELDTKAFHRTPTAGAAEYTPW